MTMISVRSALQAVLALSFSLRWRLRRGAAAYGAPGLATNPENEWVVVLPGMYGHPICAGHQFDWPEEVDGDFVVDDPAVYKADWKGKCFYWFDSANDADVKHIPYGCHLDLERFGALHISTDNGALQGRMPCWQDFGPGSGAYDGSGGKENRFVCCPHEAVWARFPRGGIQHGDWQKCEGTAWPANGFPAAKEPPHKHSCYP